MTKLIDKIARRKHATDILLRYATSAVQRLAGSYDKDPHRGTANAVHLDRWFSGNGWKNIVDTTPAGKPRDEKLLQYYISQLKSISGGRIQYANSYPIRDEKGNTKYHLIFATGNRLGIKIMSQTLYTAEQTYNKEYQEYLRNAYTHPEQLSLLDPFDFEIHHQVESLEDKICKTIMNIGKQQSTWEYEDLLYELIIHHDLFAEVSDKTFRNACKHLHQKGHIQRISTNNAWNTGTQFTIISD